MGTRNPICVLGMHRSGTSLIARVLNLLGVYLGPQEHLMKPDRFNPKGYWEHQGIVALDDEILARLGGSWRDPPTFPPGWQDSPGLADLRQRARKLIQDEFGAATCWGWKDPRTCLTLPFWKRLLPPLYYVICLRNPADVALSLAHTMPVEQAMDLWHVYTASAFEHTTGQPRQMVVYDDFMAHWRHELPRLARFGGNRETGPAESIFEAVQEAVAAELHHHQTPVQDVVDEPRLAFPAKALYMALQLSVGLERGSQPDSTSRHLQDALNTFTRCSGEARETLNQLQSRLTHYSERMGHLETMSQEATNREAALHAAESKIEEQGAQIREKVARFEQQRLKNLRRESAARNRIVGQLEAVIERFQQNFHDHLQEQVEQLRIELADRDTRILAALEESRRGHANGQSPTPVSVVAWPTLKNKIDRQQYREMIERVRRVVASAVPANATVAVASKGDPELLQLQGRNGWHFPQNDDGTYTGFHPKDSAAALQELQRIRARGAEFLLFPATAFWWLKYYKDFAAQLATDCRVVLRDEQTCVLFALQEKPAQKPATVPVEAPEYHQLARRVRGVVEGLLPPNASVLVVSKGDPALLELGSRTASHFPQDANGGYEGGYPVNSEAGIAHLEELRRKGFQYLVVPTTASRRVDHWGEFGEHLEVHYRAIVRQRHVCTIFDLNER